MNRCRSACCGIRRRGRRHRGTCCQYQPTEVEVEAAQVVEEVVRAEVVAVLVGVAEEVRAEVVVLVVAEEVRVEVAVVLVVGQVVVRATAEVVPVVVAAGAPESALYQLSVAP
jgi:hypothetical protein